MSKIKVSCSGCGRIAKVEEGEELLPCENCGGERKPFDWGAGRAEQSPPPPPAPSAPPPTRPRASVASRRAARDEMRRKSKGMPGWLMILLGFVVVVGLILAYAFWQVADAVDRAIDQQEQMVEEAARAQQAWEARKVDFEASIGRFTGAWGANDRSALASLMPGEKALQDKAFALLDRSLEKYELDASAALPPIDDRRELWSERDPYNVKSYFGVARSDGGPLVKLRTNWMWQDGAWRLVELHVRPTSRD